MVEEFASKFLKLINKQNQSKVPSMGVNPQLPETIEMPHHEHITSEKTYCSPESISKLDIFKSMDPVYHNTEEDFDSGRYELKKLSKILNCKNIEKSYEKLELQQQAVSKKASQLIQEKQRVYNQEFQKIRRIQYQLDNSLQICKRSRNNLQQAKKQFTTSSLRILANYKKRQTVQNLLKNLQMIKTLMEIIVVVTLSVLHGISQTVTMVLSRDIGGIRFERAVCYFQQQTEDQLQELLKKNHFPAAISLLLECQSAARTYEHLFCVAALSRKLQDTLDQTEETLEVTLIRLCMKFNSNTYTSVQRAYKLLQKTQTAIDHLYMHFTAAIHNSAFSIIRHHAGGDIERQYVQLCQSVPRENFIDCFNELCKTLWKILSSYHQVFSWHKAICHQEKIIDATKFEDTFNNNYIIQKLANGMPKMWYDAEIKISTYLKEVNLTSFKFEQFVQVMGIVNRSIEVGEELCGSKSENLQNSMKNQSFIYFSHYHASRLEELAIFLEYEGWELCPVKHNFVAAHLREFKTLRPILMNCRDWTHDDEPPGNGNSIFSCMSKYSDTEISSSHVARDESMDEDILVNICDDGSDNYTEDSDEESVDKTMRKRKLGNAVPMVTNTSLSILRVCGRYLQMSRLLQSIAVTVTQNMIQLFEFYFYCVHKFFTSDLRDLSNSLYSPTLKLTLARIRENLIHEERTEDLKQANFKIRQPMLSSSVDLGNEKKLFGLAERIVGVESLVFLSEQYNTLRSYLEHLNFENTGDDGPFNQFYSQTVASALDMRKPIYMAVIMRSIDVAEVISIMGKVNWEVKDVMSQHSEYVDTILKHIEAIRINIERVDRRITISDGAKYALWESVAHLITHTLVEGFSNAKKCSNGGRGLMQLDFTQLRSKFELITSARPMPCSEYVETYIKAYYIPESALGEWVIEHWEYSEKQLVGLISCACQNNKKTRQRLISIVEQQRSIR